MCSAMSTDPIIQLEQKDTLNKYKESGTIANNVMKAVIQQCQIGTTIYNICSFGDKLILEMVKAVYKKIDNKGIAFPVCISPNNIAGYYSPTQDDKTKLKDGDIIKIELGVHLDGYPVIVGKTILIGNDDKKQKLIDTINKITERVSKKFIDGNTNTNIQQCIIKYATKNEYSLLEYPDINTIAPGLVSYQISREIINGNNDDDVEYTHQMIIHNPKNEHEFKMVEVKLQENEIYCLDISLSSGSGKLKRSGINTTVYKQLNKHVGLKTTAAKQTLHLLNKNFPISMKDNLTARHKLGLVECVNKQVVQPYYVYEINNDYIARTLTTIIITKKKAVIL